MRKNINLRYLILFQFPDVVSNLILLTPISAMGSWSFFFFFNYNWIQHLIEMIKNNTLYILEEIYINKNEKKKNHFEIEDEKKKSQSMLNWLTVLELLALDNWFSI